MTSSKLTLSFYHRYMCTRLLFCTFSMHMCACSPSFDPTGQERERLILPQANTFHSRPWTHLTPHTRKAHEYEHHAHEDTPARKLAYVRVHMHTPTHTYTHTYTSTHTNAHAHTHTRTCTHAHAHNPPTRTTRTPAHTHTKTYTHSCTASDATSNRAVLSNNKICARMQ